MNTPPPLPTEEYIPFLSSKSSVGDNLSSNGDVDYECPEDIHIMLSVKRKLKSVQFPNGDLLEILNKAENYLRQHCEHDSTLRCRKCGSNFNAKDSA